MLVADKRWCARALLLLIVIDHFKSFGGFVLSLNIPTWSQLSNRFVASNNPSIIDCKIDKIEEDSCNTNVTRLYRERNGWCVYSARLWLALELKGLNYETFLVEARGDTYDGSISDSDDGRPGWLGDLPLPQLQLAKSDELHCAATETSSLQLIKNLDALFPTTNPIWPPIGPEGPFCTVEDVSYMANAFIEAVPFKEARESPRAALLFCREEGYRLDPLPRTIFETFLDKIDRLLTRHPSGPFFCGGNMPSAADVIWAPLLERYAVQLPCLHGSDLSPRGRKNRWPNLKEWYEAMDRVPEYVCRIKGDAPSWRRVLYVDPWWPSADLWHPRDTVGPKGELLLSEEECCEISDGQSSFVSQKLWSKYSTSCLCLSPDGPGAEAASSLIRGHSNVLADMIRWIEDEQLPVQSPEEIDLAIRAVTLLLLDEKYERADIYNLPGVTLVLSYLEKRVCVPRDMGAPSAARIRQLALHTATRFTQ